MPAGRPKEFDETEALEKAMELFWLHGYQGIGLTELLSHMGIARQSLYDTFGNKRELFIRAIEHYRGVHLAPILSALEREDASPIESVRAMIHSFETLASDKRCRGCLVANTLVELGPHDAEIASLLKNTLGLLEKGIFQALERAEKTGELAPGKSPRELSKALTNAILGLAVSSKLGEGSAAVHDICIGTLAMLG